MILPEAGSAGFPARLVGGRIAASSLRSGTVVTLRTELSSLTGRLEFVGSSMKLAPTSAVEIPAGKTVRLLVLATTPQLRLQLLADSEPSSLVTKSAQALGARHAVTALGLPRAAGIEAVVRALINSHRELSPDWIRTLSAHIGKELPERVRQRRARVAVELADRHMDLDGRDDHGEQLISFLTDGRWSPGHRGDRRPPKDGSQKSRNVTSLRSFLSRTTSTPSHPLQLFNYLQNNADLHWVVIPIGASQNGTTTAGTLRVGLDQVNHSPREATLAVGVGTGVWWFSWKIGSAGAVLSCWETDANTPEIPDSLLARIRVRGHTGVIGYQNGDGFSGTSSDVNKLGVDEYG